MPVDVEVVGVRRRAAVLEHVHPPGVVRADAHVVGHHVEQLAHAVLRAAPSRSARSPPSPPISGLISSWPPRRSRACCPARARRYRRAIDMADAEPRAGTAGSRTRVVEVEVAMELQAVGRARHDRARAAPAPARRGRSARRRAAIDAKRGSLACASSASGRRCAASSGCSSTVPGRLAWSSQAERRLRAAPASAAALRAAAKRVHRLGELGASCAAPRRGAARCLRAAGRRARARAAGARAPAPGRRAAARRSRLVREEAERAGARRGRGRSTSRRASAGRACSPRRARARG